MKVDQRSTVPNDRGSLRNIETHLIIIDRLADALKRYARSHAAVADPQYLGTVLCISRELGFRARAIKAERERLREDVLAALGVE